MCGLICVYPEPVQIGQGMRFSGIGLWRRAVHQTIVLKSSPKTIYDGLQIGSLSIT